MPEAVIAVKVNKKLSKNLKRKIRSRISIGGFEKL